MISSRTVAADDKTWWWGDKMLRPDAIKKVKIIYDVLKTDLSPDIFVQVSALRLARNIFDALKEEEFK